MDVVIAGTGQRDKGQPYRLLSRPVPLPTPKSERDKSRRCPCPVPMSR